MALTSLGAGSTPQYSINDILQYTNQLQTQATSSGPSAFRKVLGALAGGVGNMFMPGVGSVIGNLISGGGGSGARGAAGAGAAGAGGAGAGIGNLMGDTTQYLQLQAQMEAESRQFEAITTIMKARQDAAMDAIRNIKS
jgi:hypothetical protein